MIKWRTDAQMTSFFGYLLYRTNRVHVAVRLFSNWSQKCGETSVTHSATASCATFLFCGQFITEQTLGDMESSCQIEQISPDSV